MYPQQELTRLAEHKRTLRRKIASNRAQCVEAATRVTHSLAWLDRALATWRRLSPLALLAAIPLGFLVKRTGVPRLKLLGSLLRWSPFVFGAMRGINAISNPAGPDPARARAASRQQASPAQRVIFPRDSRNRTMPNSPGLPNQS